MDIPKNHELTLHAVTTKSPSVSQLVNELYAVAHKKLFGSSGLATKDPAGKYIVEHQQDKSVKVVDRQTGLFVAITKVDSSLSCLEIGKLTCKEIDVGGNLTAIIW